MHLYQAIILAIVQGLTEFLPVSSTAHLVLFSWLLGWPEGGLPFDVALHVGTLAAVLLYFLRDWVELTLAGFGMHFPAKATEFQVRQNRRMFWYLVIGTIPAGTVGFFFEKKVDESLQSPLSAGVTMAIAGALIIVGLLMWFADRLPNHTRELDQTTMADALGIGAAQAIALFPGVSRSGITITAGLFRNMTREAAARFSFLLSTPVIAGAALKETPKLLALHRSGGLDMPMSTVLISILVSGIVGYGVIAFFLRYLQTHTLKLFVYYRLLFGMLILLLVFLHSGHAR
jgi:undecaprenyl-diphosphatase